MIEMKQNETFVSEGGGLMVGNKQKQVRKHSKTDAFAILVISEVKQQKPSQNFRFQCHPRK